MNRTPCWIALVVVVTLCGTTANGGTFVDTVPIDLKTTSISGTLPFDVPFQLVGEVPVDVDSLWVVVETLDNDKIRKGVVEPSNECPCSYREGDRTDGVFIASLGLVLGDATTRGFNILVCALGANKNYRFTFNHTVRLSEARRKSLRNDLIVLFDNVFWETKSGSVDEAMREEIKAQMLDKIRQKVKTPVSAVSGSYLDPKAEIPNWFRDSGDNVIAAQMNMEIAVEELQVNSDLLWNYLESLKGSDALEALREGIGCCDGGGASNALEALNGLLETEQTETLALGGLPKKLGTLLPPTAVFDSLMTVGLERYGRLHRDLESIQRWLNACSSSECAESLDPQIRNRFGKNENELKAKIEQAIARADLAQARVETLVELRRGRTAQISRFVREASLRLSSAVGILGGTTGDFKTRGNWYISADVGIAFLPQVGHRVVPYIGTNFYTQPVNKDAALTSGDWCRAFRRRASFMVGVTTSSLAEAGVREDLFDSFNLVTGGGFRVTSSFRLNGGAIWYRGLDPITEEESVAVSWFVSASLDWDIASTLRMISKIFP